MAAVVLLLAQTNLFGCEGYLKIKKIPMDLRVNQP